MLLTQSVKTFEHEENKSSVNYNLQVKTFFLIETKQKKKIFVKRRWGGADDKKEIFQLEY